MNIEGNYITNNDIMRYNLQNNIYNTIEVSNIYPNDLKKQNIGAHQR